MHHFALQWGVARQTSLDALMAPVSHGLTHAESWEGRAKTELPARAYAVIITSVIYVYHV